jgi:hypothetical protein
LADIGIDPNELHWRRMPEQAQAPVSVLIDADNLTLAEACTEAKRVIAAKAGLAPDAVEITIRA